MKFMIRVGSILFWLNVFLAGLNFGGLTMPGRYWWANLVAGCACLLSTLILFYSRRCLQELSKRESSEGGN